MKTIIIFIFLFCLACLNSCYYDKLDELHPSTGLTNACSADLPATYSGAVTLIMRLNCTSCHNSNVRSGNISLETYGDVKAVAATGKLMGSVRHQSGLKPMPPGTSIRDCEIQKLQEWINAQMVE